jgi:hypothetical protein
MKSGRQSLNSWPGQTRAGLVTRKTRITHIKDGFDFLGWNFRKYNGKLLMKPSKANVEAHLGNPSSTFYRAKIG